MPSSFRSLLRVSLLYPWLLLVTHHALPEVRYDLNVDLVLSMHKMINVIGIMFAIHTSFDSLRRRRWRGNTLDSLQRRRRQRWGDATVDSLKSMKQIARKLLSARASAISLTTASLVGAANPSSMLWTHHNERSFRIAISSEYVDLRLTRNRSYETRQFPMGKGFHANVQICFKDALVIRNLLERDPD